MIRTEQANAKLNLALHLVGKRADGYHRMESLVCFLTLADTLTIAPAETLQLSIRGDFADACADPEQNLVMRAAQALQAAAGIRLGASITLEKRIPVGGGLGGGSADAAAALRGLNAFWACGFSNDALMALALTLGADVPMCLNAKPAVAQGIGEIITPLRAPLPRMALVLVHPRTPLLTAEVFRRTGPIAADCTLPDVPESSDFAAWMTYLRTTRNDLETAAIAVAPVVGDVLAALRTAEPSPALVQMTGSGACCFAIYATTEEATAASAQLRGQHPDWWVCTTQHEWT